MTELYRILNFVPDPISDSAVELDQFAAVLFLATMVGGLSVAMLATLRVLHGTLRPRTAPFRRARYGRHIEAVLIVLLLGGFIASWVVGFRLYLDLRRPPTDADQVYVIAKQWMWKSVYPGGQIELDRIVVPAGRPVRLAMTSRDVIHSFFVPSLRLKQDVLPGRFTITWLEVQVPGRYPLSCAEFCGPQHAQMKAELVALSPEDWADWIDGRSSLGGLDLAAYGAEVAAQKACLGCHAVTSYQPDEAFAGPSWLGLYGSMRVGQDGGAQIADDAYLTRSMMRPSTFVVEGYDDVMPSYQGQLEPIEVAALVEWIRMLSEEPP